MQRYGWSLQHSEWKQLSKVLNGTRWHYTNLNIKFQASVPEVPGIYLLVSDQGYASRVYGLPPGLSNALYVGRSNNLNARFKQHASNSNQNRFIRDSKMTFGTLRYVFTRIPSTSCVSVDQWLSNTERILISVLGPSANTNIPTSAALVGKLGQPVQI